MQRQSINKSRRNATFLRLTLAAPSRATGLMRPPADQQLDLSGAGCDLPIVRPRYGVPWPLVLLVASVLGIVSTTLAWQLTVSLGRTASYFRSLVVLNFVYWYAWAAFTPAIVWLAQRFRFER